MTYPLLIAEPPFQVLPALAEAVGFNEAAVLQAIHYWLNPEVNTHFREGRHWVPNLSDLLRQRFFFWDADAIEHMVAQLEQSGILMVFSGSARNVNKDASDGMKYHTINYELLEKIAPVKRVPVAPFPEDILSRQKANANARPPFTAKTEKKGDTVYTLTAQDLGHFLACELTLEIQDKDFDPEASEEGTEEEAFTSRKVICHFPKIDDDQLKQLVWEDPTLYGVIMVTFQMKIMEQLLLFCATHDAASLVIYADDGQAEELGIYHDFLIYYDQTLTAQGEKTEMVMPADQATFDAWVDFMEVVTLRLRQTLWREQKTNPAIQHYLKTLGLSEA